MASSTFRLRIDGPIFRDPHNRQITLRGINVSGDCKLPAHPDTPSYVRDNFFQGDTVSFVDRPFPASEAHTHFARLKQWGYNCIRYIFTWEALEHAGPGKYDDEFVDHTIEILRIAKDYGFYVFLDPHQDVWSRFTGGSGAPMWTLYAAGFDPEKFSSTQAALVQNTWLPDPAEFPKMAWATNYYRLAAQTMFTLFFAGRDFAPKCVMDGKNIQDYLQEHFIAACRYLAQRIHDAGDLEQEVVIGYESMNEPNKGFVGHPDLQTLPKDQNLKKTTCPTAWQGILTASGRAVEVETWDFGTLGPYKSGTQLVDPHGETAWLDPSTWDDTKYGWHRADSWKLGECVWAQHGIWDPSTDELKLPHYFSRHPSTGEKLDYEYWNNNYFLHHYRSWKLAIRSVWKDSILFMQPSPYEIPPNIKATKDEDENMVFASHFYDGITLISKHFNRLWNVDVIGVMRGKYLTPAFAIKIGESAIRNCFKDQLSVMRQEAIHLMGDRPCIFTEIGIPYDMDDKEAFRTGDYGSQILAADANAYALEGCGAQGFTWWVYTAGDSHLWGDRWNGEDLSVFCREDRALPPAAYLEGHRNDDEDDDDEEQGEDGGSGAKRRNVSLDPSSPNYSESQTSGSSATVVGPGNLTKTLSVNEMVRDDPSTTGDGNGDKTEHPPGFRALEAIVRPSPIYTHGTISSYGFDLKSCTFTLSLTSPSSALTTSQNNNDNNNNNDADNNHPTEIFLPDFHFPQKSTHVEVTGGKWTIEFEERVEGAQQQVLKWWHGKGEQTVSVKGVKRKGGALVGKEEEEEGYLEAYWAMGRNCSVM